MNLDSVKPWPYSYSSLCPYYILSILLNCPNLHISGRSLLGQMIGGIIFPACSEAFGRKKLYIVSTGLYSLICLAVGMTPSIIVISIGRFLSGFLSAIPAIVVAGSIEDMYNAKDRVWLIFLWAIVANMGLALGPIMGIYIIARLNW